MVAGEIGCGGVGDGSGGMSGRIDGYVLGEHMHWCVGASTHRIFLSLNPPPLARNPLPKSSRVDTLRRSLAHEAG